VRKAIDNGFGKEILLMAFLVVYLILLGTALITGTVEEPRYDQ
jgi:hypothetical protein